MMETGTTDDRRHMWVEKEKRFGATLVRAAWLYSSINEVRHVWQLVKAENTAVVHPNYTAGLKPLHSKTARANMMRNQPCEAEKVGSFSSYKRRGLRL